MQVMMAANVNAPDWVLEIISKLRPTVKAGTTMVMVVDAKKVPAIALRGLKRKRNTNTNKLLAKKKPINKIGINAKALGSANNVRKLIFTPVIIKKIGMKKP